MKELRRQTPAILHRIALMKATRTDGIGESARNALEAEKVEAEQKEELRKRMVSATTLKNSIAMKTGKSLRRKTRDESDA